MDKLKQKLTIQNFIIVFIILQPIIDIITGLSVEYFHPVVTIGIVIRTIFMAFLVLLGLIKADKKYKLWMIGYYAILFIYMTVFLINSYINNGTNLIFLQVKGLIKNFYLPIIIVSLIPIFKKYNIKIDKKVLNTTLIIYALTICICSFTNFSFPTYKERDKAGTVGLFYSGNEIGAILCILSPFLFVEFAKRKLKILDYLYLLLVIYAILQVGTKVPYFGLIILIMVIILACIVKGKIDKDKYLYKKAGIFFLLLISIYLVTGLTPVGDNLTKIYGDVFVVTKDTFAGTARPPKLTEFDSFEQFKTTTVSERNELLANNKEKFINANITSKILGIGFIDNYSDNIKELKLVEMDYYDIIFCNGILGTILFVVPNLIFAVALIYYTKLDKTKITIEQIYSITIALIVALMAGHVLTAPAVSIYIAIILVNYYCNIAGKKQYKAPLSLPI